MFEQLERREMMVAAIWHNLTFPVDVNGDRPATADPLDVLTLVNEINAPQFSHPITRQLPRQTSQTQRTPFLDPDCDGTVSALDVLMVVNYINAFGAGGGGRPPNSGGTYANAACSPQLLEGTDFATELTRVLHVPSDNKILQVQFEFPVFDTLSQQQIRDAFEIEVVDSTGRPVVLPYAPDRDASFSWSEGNEATFGAGAWSTAHLAGQNPSVSFDLNGIAAGTEIHVLARLVNNDSDTNTNVLIRGYEFVGTPAGTPGSAAASTFSALAARSAPIELPKLSDISGNVLAEYGRTSLSGDNNELLTELKLTNIGSQTALAPLIVVLDHFSDLDANAMRPDGILPDGRPFFDLTAQLTGQTLKAGESVRSREIRFLNDSGNRFTYGLKVYGKLNSAPSRFTSEPITSIEAGKSYRYQAVATDNDKDAISYSVVVGPDAMEVDSRTGIVRWNTQSLDIGTHRITVRATDPHGLSLEQSFDLQVVASLQNRPPNFVTDPVTDAIASSGFEITTVATGSQPAGVDVISGFRGPRLVSINAGDQTVSVHAGQNNDRFDDLSKLSTGQPKPTSTLFDVGYSVDVGLTPWVKVGDTNEINGLDQGDFNGDGILDLAVLTNQFDSITGVRRFEIVRMLGDGNGQFGEPEILGTFGQPSSTSRARNLVSADLNGDGHLDLVATETRAKRLFFIPGNGDGSFGEMVTTTYDYSISDFRVVDLDQNGTQDLVGRKSIVSDFGANHELAWWSGNGDGTFGDVQVIDRAGSGLISNQERPYDIADLNGDGLFDIVSNDDRDLPETPSNGQTIRIYLANAPGRFDPPILIDPPGPAFYYDSDWMRIADFTGDGHYDIAFMHVWHNTLELLVGDGSGVNFVQRTALDNIQPRSDNYAGSGDVADIDGDGDLDIVLTSPFKSGATHSSPQVLVNDGNGNFTRTEYGIVDFPGQVSLANEENRSFAAGAMFADYNRDGIIDIAYMTQGRDFNGVGIRLGTRPGEFGSSRSIPLFADPIDSEVHPGDYNGDGIIDLLSLRSAQMFLGNGDGTFANPFPAYSVGRANDFGSTADFNLDGLTDIVATRANTNGSRYYVALSNGDGTLRVSDDQPVESSFYGYSATKIADFNGDGYPDFIAKASVERHIDVHLNNPEAPGTFTRTFRTTTVANGINVSNFDYSFETGDFNGDGIIDIAYGDKVGTEPTKIVILAGDGLGGFSQLSESFVFDDDFLTMNFYYPGDMAVGDVDEDGALDIVSFTTVGPRVIFGNGDGTFRPRVDHYYIDTQGVMGRGLENYLIDFDEDGHLDLVEVTGQGHGVIRIRPGNGSGRFGEPLSVDIVQGGQVLAFADLDHDGHLDIAHATPLGGSGSVNLPDGVIYAGIRDGLVDLLALDLNGDGNEELLTVYENSDRLTIFTGDNLDQLTRHPDLLTGRAPKAVAAADLNGDGQFELITANRASRSISVFTGSVTDGYTSAEYATGRGPVDLAAADLNNDGKVDLVVVDDDLQALWIYTGNGTMTLATPVAVALGDTPGRLSLADVNGDGHLDAVVTLPKSNRLMILPGDGAMGFSAAVYVSSASSPSDLQVVDLNDDGHADLVATLPDSDALSVLYGRGNNQFAKAQQIQVGHHPTRVTLADADQDGRMDLIVSNRGDNTVSVIYNRFDPNEVYRYDSDAIDPDDDTITYSIVDGPGGLIINSQTGQLLWAASPDQVGEHAVTIAADDGRGGITTQSFKIDVQPARENAAPLIATEPSTTIGANEAFSYQATALDNDRHTLRYSLIDGPEGAAIDPITGKVHWDARNEAVQLGLLGQTSNVEVPADDSYKTSSVTLEGWYNLHTLTAGNGGAVFFSQSGQFGSAYYLRSMFNTQLQLIMNYEGQQLDFRVPFMPQTDRWYHVALTIDGDAQTASLLVDGAMLGQRVLPGPIPYSTSGRLQIGDISPFYTRASIDSFRVWNYARSIDEIQAGLAQQYENEPKLVLDYRFDGPEMRSVRDDSLYNNNGYKVANPQPPILVPGLAMAGLFNFTIGVEDGRGGADSQSFTVEVLPELRGAIRGQAFNDLDKNGVRNGSEPALSGRHLFIDTNGNGFPDPGESQTTTDANGNYQFNGLLPGQYPLKVSPVAGFETPLLPPVSVTANVNAQVDLAIEQLALSQIRGQLRTEDANAIAYWKVFADLDLDNENDEDEPMAMSDRAGNFAITGLSAGTYTIRAELPAGWAVATGTNGQNVSLETNAISEGNHFTLEPTNTSVTGGLHFVTSPTPAIEARQTFRYASVAMGIHHEPITYDLSLAPDGMSIDPATGLMAWRPTIAQVGEHLVIVRATNTSGSISLHDFTLTVTAPNTVPVFIHEPQGASPGFPPAYVDLIYAIDLAAQDAESQTITFNLLSGPSSAMLNATTGELRWAPTLTDVGNVPFSIELRDSLGAITVVNATITVTNSQPSATPFSITTPRTQIGLGQDYLARAQGTDALGRPLTWSLVTGPTGLLVSSNGTLRWTPGNDDLGSHSIVLQGTNVDGATESSSFTLQVVGRPVNVSPSVTSTPITSTVIGKDYQYDVQVLDGDADPLSFSLLDAPVGMSIHPTLGTIRWTPAVDQLGESDVSVQVTDPDGSTATQDFTVKVSRSGGPPTFVSVPPTEAAIGMGYLYSIVARDAEGDPLTYRLLASPAGMTIAQTTGVISWTPTADQLGQQDVVIEVSDGIGGAVTQAFAIRVSAGAPNQPPAIGSNAPRFGVVGQTYRYTVVATDPEGTDIRYSLGQAPIEMTIDPVTGIVEWTPALKYVGKSVVTFIATDAGGATAVESFELDVLAANSQPTIASTAPIDVPAGALFTYQVLGRDVDLDQLTYTLTTAPVGATIDPFGKITWPTTVALIGPHNFAVRVADPRGGVAAQSFTLSVMEDIIPPKVSLIESLGDANRKILPWQGPFIVYARAIDNVAVASLTLTANGQDIPLSAAGTAVFTFEEWAFREINATATAIDTNGNVTTKTITFDYDFPEGWSGAGAEDIPKLAITSPTDTAAVFGMVTITGTASHADFAGYKLSYRRIDETTFTQFFESTTAVINGQLGVWDTSLLINDEYIIRLEAASNAGVVNVVEHNVGLSGELKLGNFRLSFTDMVIPVAGIPIEITRIYDTLQADREGDFGYGWRLEYRNTDLRVGLPKSGLEDIGIYSALRPGVKVYLNVPGVGRQGFTFTPEIRVLPGFGSNNNLTLARPRFTPDRGVTSTLSTGTSSYLLVNELGELFAPGGIPYNPASPDFGGVYVLTTKEGTTYRIDGETGKLALVTDLNGNQLAFSESGVSSDSGTAITFLRDSLNRVVAAVDSEGNHSTYGYDSNGNLTSFEDRNKNVTTLKYESAQPHYLTELVDPLGNRGVRSDFDEAGRLIAMTDASGNTLSLSTNVGDNSQVAIDAMGNQTLFQYDNRGNTILVRNALGHTISKSFDSNDNLLTEIDELERARTYSYDSQRNLLIQTDPLGGTTRYTYSNQFRGRPSSTTDALGYTRSLSYDARGNLTSIRDQDGFLEEFSFDARGNAITQKSRAVGETKNNYDSNGNLISIIDALGNTTSFSYNTRGDVLTRSWKQTIDGTRKTFTESFVLDPEGNVMEEIDALGNKKVYAYDGNGNRVTERDELGRQTLYVYNQRNELVETVFPDNTPANTFDNPRIRNTYDANGHLTSKTDELGRTTITTYDAIAQVIARILPDSTPTDLFNNPRERMVYDAAGQLTASIDANGNRTEYGYDNAGNQVWSRDALGNRNTSEYDIGGRLTKLSDAIGVRFINVYDHLGRNVSTIFPDATKQVSIYTSDLLTSKIDQLGRITNYEYDLNGRLIEVTESNMAITQYGYDEVGNLTTIVDAAGRTTENVYDALERRVTVRKPMGQTDLRSYDAVGNLTQYLDFNGESHSFTYDERNRLISKTIPLAGISQYSYLNNGLLNIISDPRGKTTFQFDELNRLLARTEPDGAVITYEYDLAGNIESIGTIGGTTMYTFDALNRIATVSDTHGNETTYQYDTRSRLVGAVFANGVIEKREYSELDRVTLIETSRNAVATNRFRYRHDASGNVISVEELDGRRTRYEYDLADRLVKEVAHSGSLALEIELEYRYDSVGNRVQLIDESSATNYEYNDNDQLISESTNGSLTTISYDSNGNVLEKKSNGNTQTYAWTGENRLASVDLDGNETVDALFEYDADGNRVSSRENGKRTKFLVDTNRNLPQVVTEYDDNKTILVEYSFGIDVVSQIRNGESYYYHTDRLGSVVAVANAAGEIVNLYRYNGYGELVVESVTVENRHLFNGEVVDPATGLIYLRARFYDKSAGRFVSTDPHDGTLHAPVSRHDYLYAAANPIRYIDPLGLTPTLKEVLVVLNIISWVSLAGSSVLALQGENTWSARLSYISLLTGVTGAITGLAGRFIAKQAAANAAASQQAAFVLARDQFHAAALVVEVELRNLFQLFKTNASGITGLKNISTGFVETMRANGVLTAELAREAIKQLLKDRSKYLNYSDEVIKALRTIADGV